jgi:magnesium chelatase accessory protein
MSDRPDWERDGRDWPNREASRFPVAGGLRLLLLHGTGAATHSWRDLAPLLAERFEVIAPDLPGHGFTETPPVRHLSLQGMADAVGTLLRQLDKHPDLVVGHSAGAAIAAHMCLDGEIEPRALISLNGALLPLHCLPGHFFSPAAKLLAATPFLPRLFARHAGAPEAVERLVRSTGSTLDPVGIELYRRLIARPGHVGATLSMMANWDLESLERNLSSLKPALFLLVGDNDRTVPPAEALRLRALIPEAELVTLPRLGHLAHEEKPAEVADLITCIAEAVGVLKRQ